MANSQPLRREFDVLWRTGISGDKEEILETAAVCSLGLDAGDTTLTRTFYKQENDDTRAEDHLLEWLQDQPLLQEADDVHIKIFLNYSPQGATAEGLVNFIQEMEAQDKSVEMTLRFVRLYKVRGEEEAEENKYGLRLLKRSKVTVDVVRECDWLFLLSVLINRETNRRQGRAVDKVKRELNEIFKDSKDEETNTERVETVETESNTETAETADAGVMTAAVEEKDSSSDEEED